MTDVFLKLTGNEAQAVAALRALGVDRETIPEIASVYNHDVNVHFIPDLLVTRGTRDQDGNVVTPDVFDGPHLMVRFVSRRLNDIAAAKIIEHREGLPDIPRPLPQGLKVVPNPGTIEWA